MSEGVGRIIKPFLGFKGTQESILISLRTTEELSQSSVALLWQSWDQMQGTWIFFSRQQVSLPLEEFALTHLTTPVFIIFFAKGP